MLPNAIKQNNESQTKDFSFTQIRNLSQELRIAKSDYILDKYKIFHRRFL